MISKARNRFMFKRYFEIANQTAAFLLVYGSTKSGTWVTSDFSGLQNPGSSHNCGLPH